MVIIAYELESFTQKILHFILKISRKYMHVLTYEGRFSIVEQSFVAD